jgi:phosphotransferase system HPr (HPr) family protein
VTPDGPKPTSGEALKREVIVANSQGLHIRPAAAFAELAARYQANVTVSREGGERVNGKLWPDLLLLVAEKGTKLLIEAEGRDANDALDALAKLLETYETTSGEANGAGHDEASVKSNERAPGQP